MIKQFSKKFIAAMILFMAFSPWKTMAQIFKVDEDESDVKYGIEKIGEELSPTGVAGEGDVGNLILKYVNFALPFLSLAAFVGFVYAGFLYVTAYGNDEQIQKAKKILIYSIAGLVLVILSYTIVNLFTGQLVEDIGSAGDGGVGTGVRQPPVNP